jgi:hypothetical protein
MSEHIVTLKGGSYAYTGLVHRFFKVASKKGRRKLKDEITFLTSLPTEVKHLYPEIIFHGESNDKVYMEQVYYDLPTLTQCLILQKIGVDEAIGYIRWLFVELFGNLYSKYQIPCPSDYLKQYHFLRVWYRIKHTLERAPIFSQFLNASTIFLNGKEYFNIPAILLFIENNELLCRKIKPNFVSPFVHGDLHFGNILVDFTKRKCIVLDPRGYEYCDPYYDFGKLSHSANGKYDLIHEEMFDLSWKITGKSIIASLQFPETQVLRLYEEINYNLKPMYYEFTQDNEAWLKTLFNEAMHFCSDMPFHLQEDNLEQKSIAIYLTGVLLLNEFIEATNVSFPGKYWTELAQESINHFEQIIWLNEG